MQITEVRIKLMEDPHERLMAFCSVTLDGCFVIRDLKLIQGKTRPFVAMPSRKLTDRCPRCHMKNHLRAAFCNQCGARLRDDRAVKGDDGRAKLYADIAHPINSGCRDAIQAEVVRAYERETVLSKQPDYVCTYDDYGEERFADLDEYEFAAESLGENGTNHRVDAPEPLSGNHEGDFGQQPQPVRRSNDEEFGAGLI
ncbi:MAG: SpoVG family protein [Planctomycetaceae bacterium]